MYKLLVFIYACVCNNCIVLFTFTLRPYRKDQFSSSCFKSFYKVVHDRPKCLQNMTDVFSICEVGLFLTKETEIDLLFAQKSVLSNSVHFLKMQRALCFDQKSIFLKRACFCEKQRYSHGCCGLDLGVDRVHNTWPNCS